MALCGLLAGAVAAVAGNQDWARLPGSQETQADFASVASTTTDATAPPVTALALVLLATWGVVLVSRGRWRRGVTWLGLLAALGVVAFAVVAWVGTPSTLAAASSAVTGTTQAASRTWWSYVGVGAGLAAVATSVVATRSVASWPEMGRRYDAPGEGPAAPRADVAAQEQTNLDLWRAIDEGRDPTEGSTH